MLQLTPFLLFDGNCDEAMGFYQTCLGGDLTIVRLGDTPMKAGFPEGQHRKVANAHLKAGLVELSATDWLHPTRKPVSGNTAAVYLTGEPASIRAAFDSLCVGAESESLVHLKQMPFGLYGRLRDRYGVEWYFRGQEASG